MADVRAKTAKIDKNMSRRTAVHDSSSDSVKSASKKDDAAVALLHLVRNAKRNSSAEYEYGGDSAIHHSGGTTAIATK